ncbi:hypothetical protein D3C86_1528900 [compost metagenome]
MCQNFRLDFSGAEIIKGLHEFVTGEIAGIPVGEIARETSPRRPRKQYRCASGVSVGRYLDEPEQAFLEIVVVTVHEDQSRAPGCSHIDEFLVRDNFAFDDRKGRRGIW